MVKISEGYANFCGWYHILNLFFNIESKVATFERYNQMCEIAYNVIEMLLNPDKNNVYDRNLPPPKPKFPFPAQTFLVFILKKLIFIYIFIQ